MTDRSDLDADRSDLDGLRLERDAERGVASVRWARTRRRRRSRPMNYPFGTTATASISTLMPGIASRLTSISVLAGRASPKNS